MNTIEIVEATKDDAALLAKLGRQTFIESHGHSASSADVDAYIQRAYSPEACEQELNDADNIYHFLYYNKEPAGFTKILLNKSIPGQAIPNISKLERIYVLQQFYSMKLGLALLNFNIELSKSRHQAGIWLYTWIENERAISFYKKAGFTIIGNYDFKISENHSNPNHQMLLRF